MVDSEQVVGAFADPNGDIQLYTPASFPHHQGWVRLNIPYEPMHSAIGRPSMAWTGTPMTNALAADATITTGMATKDVQASFETPPSTYGRFYIVYVNANPPDDRSYKSQSRPYANVLRRRHRPAENRSRLVLR